MNDITYRPFIRDSALGDINIQIPNLEIPVYKPRYSQPLEDDTETEVQSQVEEIRNPEPIVQETTVHKFNSKKDFKDTMLPIYERLLKSKGLNPAFAKSLVAQDGLESAWGSKPAGSYNFGGIKGKGTTKRTREVINGKDVYINDQFRNFKSLEDYANFKIDLLNNKRYNAFSGDIKEFANRVHRGGYATDPRYANILNQVIASAKHGGVLKFQQGGIQEGKQWLEDWYKSRKGLVKQNVKQVLPIPLPVAQAPTKKKDTTLYAQLGLKIPKYQEPSGKLMNRSTRIWMQDKNGEYAWAKRNNVSRPEFWDRLRDENKESIVDWENPNSIATHKLGYGEIDNKIIIYPEVQKVNEKLIDYTRPPYSHNAGIINAYETGNYVTAPNEKLAENFTTTYKQKYPGFIEHDVFEDEVSRDVYNSKSDKINYVYNKLLANGYTRMQASAILGSLFIEGQLDENKKETGGNGYGLLQWTDSTRKNNLKEFKSSTAKNEFERQVDFLIHELKNPDVWLGQRKLDEFLNAEDIDSATEILAKRFCRPRTGSEKMDARKEVARFYVNQQPRYSLTDKYIYGQ